MASSVDLICFLFLSSLWSSCNAASNTLKPGETLDSSSSLVSANGKFTLSFQVYDHNANFKHTETSGVQVITLPGLQIKRRPLYTRLDWNNTLKITHRNRDGDAVVPYSGKSETINSSSVVATLKDSGNFVLEEMSSDGSAKRVLWQSFDYPGDSLLPDMGVMARGAGLEFMDATLSDSCVNDQLLRCIHVSLLCVEENAEHRPTMSDAKSMLTNESFPLPTPARPAFSLVRNSAGIDVSGNESEILSENGLSNSTILDQSVLVELDKQ